MKKTIIIISAVLLLGTLNAQQDESVPFGNFTFKSDEQIRIEAQHNAPIVNKNTDSRWFGALRINCESLEEKIEIQLNEYQKDGIRSGSNLDEAEQLAVVYTALCKQ